MQQFVPPPRVTPGMTDAWTFSYLFQTAAEEKSRHFQIVPERKEQSGSVGFYEPHLKVDLPRER
jgi:hypothetical protein